MSKLLNNSQSTKVHKVRNTTSLTCAPRIAIIGCGAITEAYHLPALAKNQAILKNLILVDMDEDRLREIASKFEVRNYVQDYRQILDRVHGVVVAVPHHLHYPISMDCLSQGVHVLCEKPLAESSVEARNMVVQAQKSGVTICVNHTRRLFPAYAKIKELIADGTLGTLISIKYADGRLFSWPTTSGCYFKTTSHRGVLFDKGIHSLDTICWWLGAKPEVVSSENDSFGGCEGVALVKLLHHDTIIDVHYSWLAKLQNSFTITGELGTIEGGIEEWGSVTITYNSGKRVKLKLNAKERVYNDFSDKMLANFIDVVSKGAKALVPASDVILSIELMRECYQRATRFSMPWYETLENVNGR